MQDHLQAVGIGGRNGLEHIAANVATSVLESQLIGPKLQTVADHVWLFEHDSKDARLRLQDRAHEMPMPSADIAKRSDLGKVVVAQCFQSQNRLDRGIARHALLEALSVV